MSKEHGFSRRNFMKATGIMASAAALGSVAASATASSEAQAADSHSTLDRAFRGRMFFANDLQFETISQAAERIFPKDENGPGAIELAVPYFIDNQLASGYGFNSREYTMGPHFEGAPTQGYQTALNNRDLFLQGIDAINLQSKATC